MTFADLMISAVLILVIITMIYQTRQFTALSKSIDAFCEELQEQSLVFIDDEIEDIDGGDYDADGIITESKAA